MFNTIIDPKTLKKVNINSKSNVKILKKYVNYFLGGAQKKKKR